MTLLPALPLLAFPVLLTIAGLKDAISFTIPNWVSAALLVAFPVAVLAAGLPTGLIAQHAAVGGVALLIGMGMFALNWIGGGDAKLFSASALWLGLAGLPAYLVWTAIAGGALAIGLVLCRKAYALMPVPAAPGWVHGLMQAKGDIPYGVAMAAGALMAFPETSLFRAVL